MDSQLPERSCNSVNKIVLSITISVTIFTILSPNCINDDAVSRTFNRSNGVGEQIFSLLGVEWRHALALIKDSR
jgi:hypothetical protein